MNKKVKLLILVLIILLLCISFYFVKLYVEKDKRPVIEEIPVDSITEISWERGGKRRAVLTQTGKNGFWECEGVPVKRVFMNDIFNSIKKIRAEQIIQNPEDLTVFGLNPPYVSVEIKADKVYTFYIGSKNEYTNGFYVSFKDDSNVYLLPDTSKLEYAFNYDIDIFLQAQQQ